MAGDRKLGMQSVGGGWRNLAATQGANDAAKVQAKYVRKSMRKHDREQAKLPARPISIRPMCIDDAAYVLDSWANSYRRSVITGPIEREVFNIEQRARINRLISRPASRVFVACDAEKTEQIRGWVCFEPPLRDDGFAILHYVCVQPSHQQQGIGTALVNVARQTAKDADAMMWATHETQPMRHIREKWNLLYNPYLLEVGANR